MTGKRKPVNMMADEHPYTSQPDQYVLGETAGEFRLDHLTETADATLALARQARRTLRIFTHDLDEKLYGTNAFTAAVSEFARRNEHTTMRILVRDPMPAIRAHHPLVELLRTLPSHIETRRMPAEQATDSFALMLADDNGLLYRPYHDRFEGMVTFSAGPKGLERRKWFDRIWEEGLPEREFRRLSI